MGVVHTRIPLAAMDMHWPQSSFVTYVAPTESDASLSGIDGHGNTVGKIQNCNDVKIQADEDQTITDAQWQCEGTSVGNVKSVERARSLCEKANCTRYSWDRYNHKLLLCSGAPRDKLLLKEGVVSAFSMKALRKGMTDQLVPNHRASCDKVLRGPIHNTFTTAEAQSYCAAQPGCTHWTMSSVGAATRPYDLWLCGGKVDIDHKAGFLSGVRDTTTDTTSTAPGHLSTTGCDSQSSVMSEACARWPNACLRASEFMM